MKKSLFLFFIAINFCAFAQFEPNYDEAKVPEYTLPKLLVSNSGKKIKNVQDWENTRRPEILDLFKDEMYGNIPDKEVKVTYETIESKKNIFDGIASRKQIRIIFSKNDLKLSAELLIYLPNNRDGSVPVFLGYNRSGNHTVIPDSEIILTKSWVDNDPNLDIFSNITNELSRGFNSDRWPIIYILSRGYGVAVMYYGDIDPDFDDGFQNGLHPLFFGEHQSKPAKDEWGSIGAWAYGLSKALDYFETDDGIDHHKIAVLGHSRRGKTSLWAGAMDERFALTISNESGCGGAALSMRKFGETVERINTAFPHWFSDNFNKYNNNEDALPVDQHMLIALMAPRPVYIASAKGDRWSDPKGEFLSGVLAGPVYELYGLKGVQSKTMPKLNNPYLEGYIGYHIRSGEHDLTYYDWLQFINFADKHLK